MRLAALVVPLLLTPLCAQQFHLPPGLEKLNDSAQETVNVTLDGPILQLAAKFMDDRDPHSAAVKKIVAGLQGVYVRSWEFSDANAYSPADLEALRSGFQTPDWSRIVDMRSKEHENAEVYFKSNGNGQLGGICVIAAERRELTIVNVVGVIDPSQIALLSGEFGIPHFEKIYGDAGR